MKAGWHNKLAGSRMEKEILQVVSFWWPKANAYRDGERWLVYTLEEWAAKLPGTPSERSVRRALAQLKANGILITERHFHPFRYCRGPVLWVRPNIEQIGRYLAGTWPLPGRNLAGTYEQRTDEHMTDGQAYSGDPPGQPHEAKSVQDTAQEDEMAAVDFLAKKKAGATVESALASFDQKKSTAKDWPNVRTPLRAHECLRDACLAAGYPAPGAFNKMRGGQMKTMVNRMVDQGLAGDEVAQVIFFVCAKWAEFIGWTKTTFNVTVQGTAPNHSSLTMYAGEAVGFWQSYATTADTVLEKQANDGGSSLDEEF